MGGWRRIWLLDGIEGSIQTKSTIQTIESPGTSGVDGGVFLCVEYIWVLDVLDGAWARGKLGLD